jgi:hypothetical protein
MGVDHCLAALRPNCATTFRSEMGLVEACRQTLGMTAFRVSILAGDETLLWAANVEAHDGYDAKQRAIAIMRLGGGMRGKLGHPPPGPFMVRIERAKTRLR